MGMKIKAESADTPYLLLNQFVSERQAQAHAGRFATQSAVGISGMTRYSKLAVHHHIPLSFKTLKALLTTEICWAYQAGPQAFAALSGRDHIDPSDLTTPPAVQ